MPKQPLYSFTGTVQEDNGGLLEVQFDRAVSAEGLQVRRARINPPDNGDASSILGKSITGEFVLFASGTLPNITPCGHVFNYNMAE